MRLARAFNEPDWTKLAERPSHWAAAWRDFERHTGPLELGERLDYLFSLQTLLIARMMGNNRLDLDDIMPNWGGDQVEKDPDALWDKLMFGTKLAEQAGAIHGDHQNACIVDHGSDR